MLLHLTRCPSVTSVNVSGHGGGARATTTSALLDVVRSSRSLRFIHVSRYHSNAAGSPDEIEYVLPPRTQAHHNGFELSALSFALDMWKQHNPVLERLALFAADARQSDAKEALALEGVPPSQLPLALQLSAAASALSRRNRLIRRASGQCGVLL